MTNNAISRAHGLASSTSNMAADGLEWFATDLNAGEVVCHHCHLVAAVIGCDCWVA